MLRRTHGEVAGDLVTTTPGAPLMFRPTVVQTPAFITITILVWRFACGLIRLLYRHPVAILATLTPSIWSSGTAGRRRPGRSVPSSSRSRPGG
ncbi:hypothetical protein ACFQGX_29285 [Nonomuraea dietziae]|uniref:hypothetical protein n=1 Tax=Nonomuraea dietziae TaxID=65515 RepID=UPI00360D4BB7